MNHGFLLLVWLGIALSACSQGKPVASEIDAGLSAKGVTLTMAVPGGQIVVKADRLTATEDGEEMRFGGDASFAVQTGAQRSSEGRGFKAMSKRITVKRGGTKIVLTGDVRARFAETAHRRDAGATEQPREVRSQQLEVEHKRRRAVFTGRVRATRSGQPYQGDKLVVKYNAKGGIVSLKPEATVP